MILRFLSRPLFGAVFVLLVSFIVYMMTLAPGLGFIDAGELATTASTLGIAHPTGYPLFTLIGHLFSILPIASTVIARLNIMSAFFAAMGAGACVYLVHEIHLYWLVAKSKVKVEVKGKKKEEKPVELTTNETKIHQATAAGIFTGIIIAFSETWWANATSIEVYPLHQFFLPVILTFFLRMLRTDNKRAGFLFAITLGLSFSNHLTTVLLAPACLYAFFARFGVGGDSWKRIGKLVLPFVLGLLPYAYLFINASSNPLMNWGDPSNLGNFMKHVTGGQYKVWMFTGQNAGKQFGEFWSGLPGEFNVIIILMALTSIALFWLVTSKSRVHILAFLYLLFFGCVFYAINYDIHDIDSYFILSYLTLGILSSFFFLRFSGKAQSPLYVTIAAIGLGALLITMHYNDSDESGNHMVDDFTMNMLQNLPKDAIVISSAWDFWVSGSFYYQHVEKIRPDITVIDVALLRDRPWYYKHLELVAPKLLVNSRKELDAFMPNLIAFDKGDNYDGTAITASYRNFTEALIRNNQDRPIYITSESVSERDELFAPSFKAIPAGVAFRLVERDTLFDVPFPKINWRDENYKKRNYYTDNARLLQALPLAATAQSYLDRGDKVMALKFIDAALRFKPDMSVEVESLKGRDKDFALSVNDRFTQLESGRASLLSR
jgi:hypothetical protein